MLLVKAQLTIASESRAGFLRHVRELAQASRDEAGCLSFACYEDPDTPSRFIVLSEWEDRPSLERHEASSHLAHFKASAASMIVSREPTRVYSVSAVGGLPPA